MAKGRKRPDGTLSPRASSAPASPSPRKPRARKSGGARKPAGPSSPSPSPRGGGESAGVVALVALAIGALVAIVGYAGVYLVTPHRGRGAVVRVAMPTEHNGDAVALALYNAGVIDRPWLFAWLLAVTGTADTAPQGTLSFRDDLTPRAVLRALAAGVGVIRVTIPEGYSRFEIARRLAEQNVVPSADAFIARTQDPAVLARYGVAGDSLEGYLYPDSYDLSPGANIDDVIDRMVRTFRRRLADVRARHPEGVERATSAGLDERGIVTLASMVEKETGAADDRPRVAAVFWNRLTVDGFEPRLLQSDPTIVYGCHAAHPPSCADAPSTGRIPITRAMLDDAANPYNTYRRAGLPPGPVANPGVRALEAVLAPAATRDLYFVAMGNGRSAFAATRAEHEANVQRYLRSARTATDAASGD